MSITTFTFFYCQTNAFCASHKQKKQISVHFHPFAKRIANFQMMKNEKQWKRQNDNYYYCKRQAEFIKRNEQKDQLAPFSRSRVERSAQLFFCTSRTEKKQRKRIVRAMNNEWQSERIVIKFMVIHFPFFFVFFIFFFLLSLWSTQRISHSHFVHLSWCSVGASRTSWHATNASSQWSKLCRPLSWNFTFIFRCRTRRHYCRFSYLQLNCFVVFNELAAGGKQVNVQQIIQRHFRSTRLFILSPCPYGLNGKWGTSSNKDRPSSFEFQRFNRKKIETAIIFSIGSVNK